MEEQLKEAAISGDVEFLRAARGSGKTNDYFLTEFTPPTDGGDFAGNILHLAALNKKKGSSAEEFVKEVMEILPTSDLRRLLTQKVSCKWVKDQNPVHLAAKLRNNKIIKLFLSIYTSSSSSSDDDDDDDKPWLMKDSEGATPLHVALEYRQEECARAIWEMDKEVLCNMVDKHGNSPLYIAVNHDVSQLALEMLELAPNCSFSGPYSHTPLHLAPFCTEAVCKALLEKGGSNIIQQTNYDGVSVLQMWIQMGKLWPFQCLVEFSSSDVVQLMSTTDKSRGNNPLHVLGSLEHRETTLDIARLLVDVYKKEISPSQSINPAGDGNDKVPWLMRNKQGDTPLHSALRSSQIKLAEIFLSADERALVNGEESPLYIAMDQGSSLTERIWDIAKRRNWKNELLTSLHGPNVLHLAASHSRLSEEFCYELVKEVPHWLITQSDREGKTPLEKACDARATGFIRALLKRAPLAWVEECERGRVPVIRFLIENCPESLDFRMDTPLHHIRLGTYEQYKEFLSIPRIRDLKNSRNSQRATPLHQAIRHGNLKLAELLLINGVDLKIKDNNGQTAKDLLAAACRLSDQGHDWDLMCRSIGIDVRLKTTYIHSETDLLTVRDTLSVVAALLTTITFTAGFTLPGGFNQNTGEAIFAKKPGFLVFLIADTFAMCCSMLVLVCLIWSMVTDRYKSLTLIDCSIVILMLALYSTMLAFTAAIFTVVFHKSLWAVILIFFMCFLIGISTKKNILYKVLSKLMPSKVRETRDPPQMPEQAEPRV